MNPVAEGDREGRDTVCSRGVWGVVTGEVLEGFGFGGVDAVIDRGNEQGWKEVVGESRWVRVGGRGPWCCGGTVEAIPFSQGCVIRFTRRLPKTRRKRQYRRASISGPQETGREGAMAYIRYATDKVQTEDLHAGLIGIWRGVCETRILVLRPRMW